MKRLQLSGHNRDELVADAVDFLQDDGIVMLPTDTAYGLAADAINPTATEAVLALKRRPAGQTTAIVVADRAMAERYAAFAPQAARLWDAFMPGPLTLVLPTTGTALAAATVKDGTVGLRYPDHEFACEVAERLGRPYTATSANLSGQPPAYEPDEFLNTLSDKTNPPHLVVDAGTLPMVPVSTVVAVTDRVRVLREGAIPTADIEATAG